MIEAKHRHPFRIPLALILAFSLTCIASSVVRAQQQEAPDKQESESGEGEEEPTEEPFAEEIIVTGTRKEGLVPTETLSPIDVFPSEAITEQAGFDLTEGITRIAPSFNTQRFPIADGTAFVRPVTLRNLSPDHTLVLVNGARQHRSALVNLQLAPLGTVNQGSQAVDFSTLPAAAIERIEVLRDGAAAQYGSDAIAGVLNVILRDASDGLSFSLQTGEYFEGDGSLTTVSGNGGFSLGSGGFLNATFEYSTSDETSRGVARPDAEFVGTVVGPELVPIGGLGQRWGDPDVEVWKLFANFGLDLNDNLTLYSHVNYADNETRSDFFYRGPVLDPQYMFTARTTLQQDLDGDFRPDPAPQSLVDNILTQGLNPADYLVADPSSPSGWVLRNPIYTLFPGGYNPNFGADLTDLGLVAGLHGETGGNLSWDARVLYGENEIDYLISETINPSLGRKSPTSFRPGSLTQEETAVNLEFVKLLDVGSLHSPLNLAFGVAYRDETYKIGAGDLESIVAGPTAAIFGVGSDGFQGFPAESAGSFGIDSIAGYVDLEASVTEQFSAGIALRAEDYDVFGSTFDWKLSLRYDLSNRFALRGTANTGFRAPTPGQIHTLNVTTSADSSGNLIPSGVYPVDNPVAVALGAIPLEPEDSNSFTFGFVAMPFPNTSLTVDYYDIEIDDRLALLNNTITEADIPRLEAAGVENAELLVNSLANFFSNAYDSRVEGVDFAIVSHFQVGSEGLLTIDFRHNYNRHEVSNVAPNTINESRVFDLENQVPENRTNLTFSYDTSRMFSGYVRATRYGEWKSTGGLFSPGDASDASTYGSEILFDVEARLRFATNYEFAIGSQNIFDTLPDKEQDPVLQFLGVTHSLTSPFGFNGGFWYARFGVNF